MMVAIDDPIEELIKDCRESERNGKSKVSDIHIIGDRFPRLRINNELREHPHGGVISKALVKTFIQRVITGHEAEYEQYKHFTAKLHSEEYGSCRVQVQPTYLGDKLIIRLLHEKIPEFSSLGLPPVVQTFPRYANGLILITGETGSGKSTTIASLLDEYNKTNYGAICTVEDPIEYIHNANLCDISQLEVGAHTPSFAEATKSMLRMDPDVILVGEIRDRYTADACIHAANTGHLVFASLHTNTAHDTIQRLIGMFPGEEQDQIKTTLASVLKAVVCQKLVPKASGAGLLAVTEILVMNDPIKNHILKQTYNMIYGELDAGRKDGMTTMERSLHEKAQDRIITHETARTYANNLTEIDKRLKTLGA